jgi:predicted RNase H-like HicB family nuclease
LCRISPNCQGAAYSAGSAEPQPEGGCTVTCPVLPNLITEADTLKDVIPNVTDALTALIEAYHDLSKPLPAVLKIGTLRHIIRQLDLNWEEFNQK